MKQPLVLLIAFVTLLGCGKKRPFSEQQEALPNASKRAVNHDSKRTNGKSDVREIAKSKLQRRDLITPGVFEESLALLQQLAAKVADEENVSHAEALNELYIALQANQLPVISSSLRGLFGKTIMDDPKGVASVMGSLPSGDLRRLGVSSITGNGLPLKQLEEVYRAMPESEDRCQIAEYLVVDYLLSNGLDSSLSLVQSMTISSERDRALDALISAMETGSLNGGKIIQKEDVEKAASYARLIGHKRALRMLERLNNRPER